jgi:hypothetical protein
MARAVCKHGCTLTASCAASPVRALAKSAETVATAACLVVRAAAASHNLLRAAATSACAQQVGEYWKPPWNKPLKSHESIASKLWDTCFHDTVIGAPILSPPNTRPLSD